MKNLTFFQAANLSDSEVKSQFIVRKKEFELVMSDIREDKMTGSIQHYIFIGQRGSGKSTLLRRIQAEINTDEKLINNLVAINLSEEQAGIYRLHDLWNRVIEEIQLKGFEVEEVDWEKLGADTADYTRALYNALQKSLNKKSKKLVLLLDNIDRILENIKTEDNHLFRELLMNHKDVRIIGGSTRLSEHHWKYDQPFYQFFRIIRIEALTQSELQDLLIFWSDLIGEPKLREFVQKSKGKLNAVRILSDGMPRTMLNLVELLINKPEEHGYEYLRHIIDRATPVYQERLTTLSPLQQKILLELSFFWDAVKVKELSETARTDSKLLSSVLNQLVELKIVEKKKGKGKNLYYLLKERFFNLWLIMTQGGPKQKAKVKWLTIFLETWYNASELKKAYSRFAKDLSSGFLPVDHAVLMTKAFVHSKHINVSERDNLIDEAEKMTISNSSYKDILPPKAKVIYKDVLDLIEKKQFDKAINLLQEVEQEDSIKDTINGYLYKSRGNSVEAEKYYLFAIEKGNVGALFNLAILYKEQGKFEEAEKYYLLAIEKGDVDALFNLAIFYKEQSKFEEAEKYYLLAIEKEDVSALYNLAILYKGQSKLKEAEKYYLLAIEKGHVSALYNLALLYKEQSKLKEAEKYYLLAIEKGHVSALYSLANLYKKQVKFEEAEKYYLLAIEKGHVSALNNLALLYKEQSKFEEAEKYYLLAIEKGEVNALNNLANLYSEQSKLKEAEKYYLLAIEKGHVSALNNLALLYKEESKFEEAEKYYLLAIEKGQVGALYNIAINFLDRNKEPQRAVQYFMEYKSKVTLDNNKLLFETLLLIWAGQPEVLKNIEFIISDIIGKKEVDSLDWFITNTLIHHQKHSVWSWFNNDLFGNTLRDALKPLYFVTAKLLKLEEVLLTQPPELNETVDDIYQYVLERQSFYYSKVE